MIKKLFKNFAVVCPALVITAICLYAIVNKPFEKEEVFCFSNRVVGIKCPSCGVTRAVWCVLHGEIKEAFYYNALFTVGIIPTFVFTTLASVNYRLGNKVKYLPKYRWKYFYTALIIIVIFTIVRNFTFYIY